MAEEAGSVIVTDISKLLSKVKQALSFRSNMDKTLKVEAMHEVSEMDSMLNRLNGMFWGLEITLEKANEDRVRLFSEQLAAPSSNITNWSKEDRAVVQPSDFPPPTHGLIVKAADLKTSSQETKRLIKEAVDPKALQLRVSKIKNLSNGALFVEFKSETYRDILEKELSKLSTLNVGRPKKKLPTLLLSFVPKEVEDADIKHTILQQNNLIHLEGPILHTKFTKRAFEDSTHVIVEASPSLRRELLALKKIKIQWCMCRV